MNLHSPTTHRRDGQAHAGRERHHNGCAPWLSDTGRRARPAGGREA